MEELQETQRTPNTTYFLLQLKSRNKSWTLEYIQVQNADSYRVVE